MWVDLVSRANLIFIEPLQIFLRAFLLAELQAHSSALFM